MLEDVIKTQQQVEVSRETYDYCNRLREIKNRIEDLENHKSELEDLIKASFGDAEEICYDGETLATYRAPKDTYYFDAKKFQTDHPDIAQEYMKLKKSTKRFVLK